MKLPSDSLIRAAVAWSSNVPGGASPKQAAPPGIALRRVVLALIAAPLRLVDAVLTFVALSFAASILWVVAYLCQVGYLDRDAMTISLSLACPLITIASYVTPAPMVIQAVRRMSAQNLPLAVFKSQAICNVLGISYGLQIHNAAVLFTNMFGLACQITFLAGNHYIRTANQEWLWYSTKFAVVLNASIYFFARVLPINLLGQAITIFNIILYSSPLIQLGGALRLRNSSSFPLGMTSMSVANNASWTVYALLIEDIVVLLPSILGYELSFFQVLVIMWCRGSLPFDLSYLLIFYGNRRESAGSEVEEDTEQQLQADEDTDSVTDEVELADPIKTLL